MTGKTSVWEVKFDLPGTWNITTLLDQDMIRKYMGTISQTEIEERKFDIDPEYYIKHYDYEPDDPDGQTLESLGCTFTHKIENGISGITVRAHRKRENMSDFFDEYTVETVRYQASQHLCEDDDIDYAIKTIETMVNLLPEDHRDAACQSFINILDYTFGQKKDFDDAIKCRRRFVRTIVSVHFRDTEFDVVIDIGSMFPWVDGAETTMIIPVREVTLKHVTGSLETFNKYADYFESLTGLKRRVFPA